MSAAHPCNLDHHWFDSLGPGAGTPSKVEGPEFSLVEMETDMLLCWIPQAPDTMGKRGDLLLSEVVPLPITKGRLGALHFGVDKTGLGQGHL